MRIDLIPKDLEGDLYQDNNKSNPVFLKKMSLLNFIRENKFILEEDSNYDSKKGIVTNYKFKSRENKVYLQVSKKDIPAFVFGE